MWVYVYVSISTCVWVCLCLYINLCVYVCISICVVVCVFYPLCFCFLWAEYFRAFCFAYNIVAGFSMVDLFGLTVV